VSQQLGSLQTHITDTFLFVSHTTSALLFKFRIIKEMPDSVASGTPYIMQYIFLVSVAAYKQDVPRKLIRHNRETGNVVPVYSMRVYGGC